MDLVSFNEEILNGKLYFLHSDTYPQIFIKYFCYKKAKFNVFPTTLKCLKKRYECIFNSFTTDVSSYRTSLLICSANQWTGFYITGPSVMKELLKAF